MLALVGLADVLNPAVLDWIVVGSLILTAGWILVPDKIDEDKMAIPRKAHGIFVTTAVTFFLAEMGDKTQIVTVALAAQFHDFLDVVSGSTPGMMIANIPVIYLGNRFADRLPAKLIHVIASLLLVVLSGVAIHHAVSDGKNCILDY